MDSIPRQPLNTSLNDYDVKDFPPFNSTRIIMAKTDTIRLNMFGLPVIQTLEDFSDETHVSKYTIFQLSKNADKYYKTYTINKKSGGKREISQPNKSMKGLQAWILANILNRLSASNSSKGFEKGSSTYFNAIPHIGSTSLLTVDLKDYFPSIKRKQVFNIFKAVGYNNLISVVLSNICTYKNSLPQGGPCSPKLANLASWRLDVRIQGYVGRRGINYTRYADDLSFSGISPIKVAQIIPMVKEIIKDENFQINPSKTRIAGLSKAKLVTGLVVTNDSVGVGTNTYKKIRAKIHSLCNQQPQEDQKLFYEVSGWLAYLNSVDIKRLNKVRKYIKRLQEKYPNSMICKFKLK